jgi:hypothetical protein
MLTAIGNTLAAQERHTVDLIDADWNVIEESVATLYSPLTGHWRLLGAFSGRYRF